MKTFSFSQNWWQFLLIVAVCYFIGCFNFAKLISRFKKRDITKIGSGNPGTMNMSREFGLKIGFLTFFCDALKGGIPALISYFIYRDYVFEGTFFVVSDLTRYVCGVAVIIGHIFPVTSHFKGGKGIASTLGLFLFSLPCDWGWFAPIVLCLLFGIVFFIAATEWGSLGSLLGVSGLSVIQLVIFVQRYNSYGVNAYLVTVYVLIMTINVLTWSAHHKNIVRLFAGEEHHTSVKKLARKKTK
ncbi:MAG: glycerol-3-phosphate acyltransferase [Clostridia bacterium]|nr:glycerol-3-phosphate acyltransferase [Clostridia bacterium]